MKRNFWTMSIAIILLFIIGICISPKTPIVCTADAKICPDGSSIVRNPNLNCEFDPCPEIEDKNYCNPESRNVQACDEMYAPVCGWFKGEEIQCIKYPCAQTYSNGCGACLDRNVDYWTDGICPDEA